MRHRRRHIPQRTTEEHLINERIKASEVRLVGEGMNGDVYSIQNALRLADEKDLDLVLISPKAIPPVCRLVDYKKFLYEQKKRTKEQKQKQTKVVVKEVRFGPNTDQHDFEFKRKHAENFLKEGAKVKASIFFRGRTIIYKERGEEILKRFFEGLEEWSDIEQLPQMEGKRMLMILSPKKKK